MVHKTKAKVGIVAPNIHLGGGAAILAHTLEALKGNYALTLVTESSLNISELNRFFGSNLMIGDFAVMRLPLPRLLTKSVTFFILKHHLVMRYAKIIRGKFDLLMSLACEMDFGCPGMQYFSNYPLLAEQLVQDFGELSKWYHKRSFFRTAYLELGRLISGFSKEGVSKNKSLAISNWTGQIVERVYGVKSSTLYPPVPSDFPQISWEEKEFGFVCVSRIAPEKRIDKVIEIIKRVRAEGWDVHLHIIGPIQDPVYGKRIEQLRSENSQWLFIEGPMQRKDLAQFVSRHRFGIHGREKEAFGIAIAEMTKAGNIVFVPSEGGPVEIVNGDQRLMYSSVEEAVEKIIALLSDEELQADIRRRLFDHSQQFSIENFRKGLKKVVDEFFEGST